MNADSPLFAPIDSLTDALLKTNACAFLPKLYGIWKTTSAIDFAKLPQSFVLKTNHDCGGVVIVPNKDAFLADKKVFNAAMTKLAEHLKKNYYKLSKEWHYNGIEPRVFAEEFLTSENEENKGLDDYRFHCFGNRIAFIQVANFTHTRNDLFDEKWQKLPVRYLNPNRETEIKKPSNLVFMCQIATALSSAISYVRVDLFVVNSRTFVGEMTFTPNGGTAKFEPSEYDKIFGDFWKI